MTRPTWDDYGLALARTAALRGDCTRRQVGAALMDEEHRIVSLGYNGVDPGQPGCLSDGACPRGKFTHEEIPGGLGNDGHEVPCIARHAEINCIEFYLRHSDLMPGLTLYITDDPCLRCRLYLARFPLKRVVTPNIDITY